MNLEELDQYRIADAVSFHDELNPKLFTNEVMLPEVRSALIDIANDFKAFLGVDDLAFVDLTVSGSNAAYSYTPHSDIDLHLLVDFDQLSHDEVYRELFDAKKYQYNQQHEILVRGFDVELYVQDAGQPHISLGEYSVVQDDWNRLPKKQHASIDDDATELKYNKLRNLAKRALQSNNEKYLLSVLATIKRYRSAGLAKGGEFGPENLAFKMIRKQGLFKDLHDMAAEFKSAGLSLEGDNGMADLTQQLVTELDVFQEEEEFRSYIGEDLLDEDVTNIPMETIRAAMAALGNKPIVWRGMNGLGTYTHVDNSLESRRHYGQAMLPQDIDIVKELGIKHVAFGALHQYKARLFGTLNAMIPIQPFRSMQSEKLEDTAHHHGADTDGIIDSYQPRMDLEDSEIIFDIKEYYMFSPYQLIIQIEDPHDMMHDSHGVGKAVLKALEETMEKLVTYKDAVALIDAAKHAVENRKDIFASEHMNEGVGLIVKGVNTTDDVGVDELKIQAEKLGFNVTPEGIPPLLTASGK